MCQERLLCQDMCLCTHAYTFSIESLLTFQIPWWACTRDNQTIQSTPFAIGLCDGSVKEHSFSRNKYKDITWELRGGHWTGSNKGCVCGRYSWRNYPSPALRLLLWCPSTSQTTKATFLLLFSMPALSPLHHSLYMQEAMSYSQQATYPQVREWDILESPTKQPTL